ncbi:MAG TPA: oligosaccharide flippase family protein [Kofleriaceae bacterium]|nr:oligosaccharide flippase family protein [Kofleriaceae bacterium]
MSVARAAAHGVAWNMLFGISSRLLTLISTLVLTRFVAPEAYGAVLAASISVVTFGVLTSFAFGQYLIAKKATPDVAFQAAVLHTGVGIVAMTVLFVFREPIGRLLETPEMSDFVLYYAIAHIIDRARYVPERLIMRELRFRTLATINGAGELAYVAAALSLAPRYAEDAIVVAVLVRAVVTSALYFGAVPRREWLVVSPLRAEVVRSLFGYGLPIMIAAAADRAATRWDNFIMSKLFGPAAMGRYNLAYSLAETPISHVAEHIGEVLMPSFSKMEEAERRPAVVKAAALMALIVSPLGVGLGAVSPTLVDAMFNEKWAGIAPMLAVLSIMTLFRPMTWSAVAYLQAVQKTRLVMWASFTRAILVLPLVALFGWQGGPTWACVGATIGYAVHSIGTIVATGRVTPLPVGPYLTGVLRPLLACLPMFGVVAGIEIAFDQLGVHPVASLLVQVVAGGAVYVASALVLVRSSALELIRLGKGAIRRRASRAPTPAGPDSTDGSV